MSFSSILLLTDTSGKFNATGEAVRADGWYGLYGGIHTVAIHFQNFTGRVYIEASLAEAPEETDWFPIYLTSTSPYVSYPRDPLRLQCPAPPPGPEQWPTTPPSYLPYGDTGVEAYVFQGNLMWIRARLDRSYLFYPEPNAQDILANYGVIKQILLNH